MSTVTIPGNTATGVVPVPPSSIPLTNGHVLVGNGSNVAADVAMSGDVTISNTGATTIGAGKVTEAMQVLADNTTNNVSTSKHGYAPKLPNDATKYLDGTGNYTVPAGGGGGLSQGEINQLFAASPSVQCGTGGANVGAITCTVAVAAGNATITCSADVRQYMKFPYAVVGTVAQAGKACLGTSVSGDGLTITCTGIGETNPLATDAVASQLVLYGCPTAIVGDLTNPPTLTYSVDASGGGISGNPGSVEIRKGIYTGPMFAAEWFATGTASGFAVGEAAVYKITGITAHALDLTAL